MQVAGPGQGPMSGETGGSDSPKRKKIACKGCHSIKVRCVDPSPGDEGDHQCARCARLRIPCVNRVPGQRGRPPKAVTANEGETVRMGSMQGLSYSPPDGYPAMHPRQHQDGNLLRPVMHQHQPFPQHSVPLPMNGVPLPMTVDSGVNGSQQRPLMPSWPTGSSKDHLQSSLASMGGPVQAGVAEASPSTASPGTSRLTGEQRLALSLAEAADMQEDAISPDWSQRIVPQAERYPDPLDVRILSALEAEQLVLDFHNHLNPHIKLLDRHYHTAARIRAASPTLFAAILATASKFFRRDLHQRLLAYANQLVGRALFDTLSEIGVIQAILTLTYWKEPEDRSAWMRVGWAIRLGFQLKLHTVRDGPLPESTLEARQILDRERAWLNLICFDMSYRLDSDYQNSPVLPMPPASRIDRWLNESISLNCLEDIFLAASISVGKIIRLTQALENTSSPMGNQTLVAHIEELLGTLYNDYFADGSIGHKALQRGLKVAYQKVYLTYRSLWVGLVRAQLVADNFQSELLLAAFSVRVWDLITTLEEAAKTDGFLDRLQDATAVLFFNIGNFLVHQLFPIVKPGTQQQNLLRCLTQIYNICGQEKRDDGAAAYIARFYRLLMQVISTRYLPPSTRPSSVGPGDNVGDGQQQGGPTEEDVSEATRALMDLFPENLNMPDDGFNFNFNLENTYWENVLPSISEDRLFLEQFMPMTGNGI